MRCGLATAENLTWLAADGLYVFIGVPMHGPPPRVRISAYRQKPYEPEEDLRNGSQTAGVLNLGSPSSPG